MPLAETDAIAQARVAALREGLNELGWSEGRNIELYIRWATNNRERLQVLAAELIGLQPDVFVTPSTPATAAAQHATRTIPIVFVTVLDPVASGFVASLARPGGTLQVLPRSNRRLAANGWDCLLRLHRQQSRWRYSRAIRPQLPLKSVRVQVQDIAEI